MIFLILPPFPSELCQTQIIVLLYYPAYISTVSLSQNHQVLRDFQLWALPSARLTQLCSHLLLSLRQQDLCLCVTTKAVYFKSLHRSSNTLRNISIYFLSVLLPLHFNVTLLTSTNQVLCNDMRHSNWGTLL